MRNEKKLDMIVSVQILPFRKGKIKEKTKELLFELDVEITEDELKSELKTFSEYRHSVQFEKIGSRK